jgi:hypothetical protein
MSVLPFDFASGYLVPVILLNGHSPEATNNVPRETAHSVGYSVSSELRDSESF